MVRSTASVAGGTPEPVCASRPGVQRCRPHIEGVLIFNLIQALQETQALASDHADDPSWREIQDQVALVIGQLTEDASDPTTEALGKQRINRTVALDQEQAELAAAAMTALHDRPEPEQIELARAALQQLDDAIG